VINSVYHYKELFVVALWGKCA